MNSYIFHFLHPENCIFSFCGSLNFDIFNFLDSQILIFLSPWILEFFRWILRVFSKPLVLSYFENYISYYISFYKALSYPVNLPINYQGIRSFHALSCTVRCMFVRRNVSTIFYLCYARYTYSSFCAIIQCK